MEPHNNIVGKDSGRALEKYEKYEELCVLHESMSDHGFGVLSCNIQNTLVSQNRRMSWIDDCPE